MLLGARTIQKEAETDLAALKQDWLFQHTLQPIHLERDAMRKNELCQQPDLSLQPAKNLGFSIICVHIPPFFVPFTVACWEREVRRFD